MSSQRTDTWVEDDGAPFETLAWAVYCVLPLCFGVLKAAQNLQRNENHQRQSFVGVPGGLEACKKRQSEPQDPSSDNVRDVCLPISGDGGARTRNKTLCNA